MNLAATVAGDPTIRAPFTAAELVEVGTGDCGPAALLADLGELCRISRKELVGGFVVGLCNLAEQVDAHLHAGRVMAGPLIRTAVAVDERAEAVGFAADDGNHQR